MVVFTKELQEFAAIFCDWDRNFVGVDASFFRPVLFESVHELKRGDEIHFELDLIERMSLRQRYLDIVS